MATRTSIRVKPLLLSRNLRIKEIFSFCLCYKLDSPKFSEKVFKIPL